METMMVKGSYILAQDIIVINNENWMVNSIEELIFDTTYRLSISKGKMFSKAIVYDHKLYKVVK